MKTVAKIFFWLVVFYISFAGGLFLAQRDLMYFPSYTKPSVNDAGIIGLEEINVTTGDGFSLYGWYKKPDIKGYPVVVWFHGNGSSLARSATRFIPYLKEGYGALFTEYRGYSGNPGKPDEEGLYSDSRAFITWLKEQGVSEEDMVFYGESIGSGPAVKMAMEYPDVRALVLEAPFTSTVEIGQKAYPFLPVSWMMRDRYENFSRIENIKTKTIIAHGTKDRVVPYALGERLFNAAPEPKTFISIEGGDHINLDDFDIGAKVRMALEGKTL